MINIGRTLNAYHRITLFRFFYAAYGQKAVCLIYVIFETIPDFAPEPLSVVLR